MAIEAFPYCEIKIENASFLNFKKGFVFGIFFALNLGQ
jgi:hypothetical protein